MDDLYLIIPDDILSAIEADKGDEYIIRLISNKIVESFGGKSLEKATELLGVYKELIEGSGK